MTNKKKKQTRTTWVSTRVNNTEFDDIQKLVDEGLYGSKSEVLRTGYKIVLLIERGKIEQIADVIKEAREDARRKDEPHE
jgi:Arc/MetJ-type ribon-helix-helix transcriptional regulator